MPELLRRWDIAVLRALNARKDAAWIPFFQFLSNTTSILAYGVPVLLLLIALIRRGRAMIVAVFGVVLTVVAADYACLAAKMIFNRVRPFVTYTDILAISDSGNASFPSGHTTQAMALAAGIMFFFPKKQFAVPAIVWACLVGFSRLYLGMHYPSDVAGGALLAWLVGWVVRLAFGRLFRKDLMRQEPLEKLRG